MAKATKEVVTNNDEDFGAIDPELKKILDSLNAQLAPAAKSGGVVFLKPGTHYIKLMFPAGRDLSNFFEPYDNEYNGKVTKYYIINGVIVKSDQDGIADREVVKHIKATTTLVRGIVAQIAAAWPLFDISSPVVRVRIYKEGDMTKYETTVERKLFDASECAFPETSIEEVALQQAEYSAKKASESTDALPFVANKKETKAVDVDY